MEAPAPGPSTYGEVVDAGIEAGFWDELHGLELVLGYAVGALPGDQMPGVDALQTGELNELLYRANELAMSGQYSEGELAGLRNWYELAVPGREVVEMLAASARRVDGASPDPAGAVIAASYTADDRVGAIIAANDCAPVDPEDFSTWGAYEGCYLMYEDVIEGVTLRVLYPAWFEGDPSVADLPLRAREGLVRSVETYTPLAPIGDMDVIFSLTTPPERSTRAVANHDATWGVASRGGSCPVTIFPSVATSSFKPIEATIAHEAWHCVQRESGYRQGVAAGTAWYREGGAEYFSKQVYPTDAYLGTFDASSPTTSLFDMSYAAWVWWQFLGSRRSPRAVADLQLQMEVARDGGRGAMKGYGPIFHRFVIEYVAGAVPRPGGGSIPPPTKVNGPLRDVGKNDKDKELEFETNAFVATRFWIAYDQELRVFESETSESGMEVGMVEASQRRDLAAWRGVFPEIRSTCDKKVWYILVPTTEEGKKTAKIHVDEIEEAVCDPCLLGTWELDLNTFQSMLMTAMDEGGGLPPGASFEISGDYYISFDDEGDFREQRDGLTIEAMFEGLSMNIVISGFAHGTYTADGENVEVINLTDDFVNVSLGGQSFAEDSQVLDGAGTYECRTDDMTLRVGAYDPLRWTRVDKILEPPPVVQPDQ